MEENTKSPFNYDENDEISDEVYFGDDNSEMIEKVIDGTADADRNNEVEEMQYEPLVDDSDEDEPEEYKVTSISEAFLRVECEIKTESAKTEIKFSYRGEQYSGVVLQKLPSGRWDYIFVVRLLGKNKRPIGEKSMKKIKVNEVTLL